MAANGERTMLWLVRQAIERPYQMGKLEGGNAVLAPNLGCAPMEDNEPAETRRDQTYTSLSFTRPQVDDNGGLRNLK